MTPKDLIRLALRDAGVNGQGQAPSDEDNADAFSHLNMMLAQWNRKRWLIWHLLDIAKVSTGATSYTVATGGDFNVPRPDRIEAAFVRFLSSNPASDWPVEVLESREDYNNIPLKTIGTVPYFCFYDAAYPTGTMYFYPVAAASIYELHITVKDTLAQFPDLTTDINLPAEYQEALLYNLAVRLRPAYQLAPDPSIARLAAASLETIRAANAQIPRLQMPSLVPVGPGRFNIFQGV